MKKSQKFIYTLKPTPEMRVKANHPGNLKIPINTTNSCDEGLLKGEAILAACKKGMQLVGYDLSGAKCQYAFLPNVVLLGCDLRNSNFTSAYLVGANLEMSNLEGAVFTCAYGRNAKTGEFNNPTRVNSLTTFYSSHPVLGKNKELDESTFDIKTVLSSNHSDKDSHQRIHIKHK